MCIWVFVGSIFKGLQDFQVLSVQGFQRYKCYSPRSKAFSKFQPCFKGLKFSSAFNELKALILECLHLSVHLRIAFLLVAVERTHHHTATTARCMLGIRLECGPKWMVDRCPHSLHNPSLRLSPTTDLQITIHSARSHQFCSANACF